MSEITADELKALIEQTYKVENEYVALRESYDHLQGTIEQVVEFLPNAIWILEHNGDVFLQNSKAKELTDLLPVLELQNNDFEVTHNDFSYLIKISHYKDKYLLSATDITEQKRKENLATMGQMAAHLSHEIRNPIGSISLLSSTLMKRVVPENRAIVSEIQKSIYRIERIIKATLLFSKGIKANIEPIYFKELLETLHAAIGYYSYGKDIRFDLPQKNFIIEGDLDLLAMMFSNFIFNAIDAIELDENDGGSVELEYSFNDSFHIFRIYDSGIAIVNKSILFEAFKSTKEKGNGLGLKLSQQIAQAHGGDVKLLEGDRKGFEVSLAK
ncbi:MAG: HAMP domain-containing sensor histidine kinase [Campylobacterota bacterium]|nr:HAMP domain-containing sensor histidine kinase [Campylobacterota bacterium]